jgi:hypothetical protein
MWNAKNKLQNSENNKILYAGVEAFTAVNIEFFHQKMEAT